MSSPSFWNWWRHRRRRYILTDIGTHVSVGHARHMSTVCAMMWFPAIAPASKGRSSAASGNLQRTLRRGNWHTGRISTAWPTRRARLPLAPIPLPRRELRALLLDCRYLRAPPLPRRCPTLKSSIGPRRLHSVRAGLHIRTIDSRRHTAATGGLMKMLPSTPKHASTMRPSPRRLSKKKSLGRRRAPTARDLHLRPRRPVETVSSPILGSQQATPPH